MISKYDFEILNEDCMVYVCEVVVVDLFVDMQEQVEGVEMFYVVYGVDGECLVVVKECNLVFVLVWQNVYVFVMVY